MQWQEVGQFQTCSPKRYYRCRPYEWGIECSQGQIQEEPVEERLGQMLMAFELPKEWQDRALAALDELLNGKQTRDRIEEIKQFIDRLDMRWDMGFMTKEEYLQKRTQLQEELRGSQPLPQNELKRLSSCSATSERHGKAAISTSASTCCAGWSKRSG